MHSWYYFTIAIDLFSEKNTNDGESHIDGLYDLTE